MQADEDPSLFWKFLELVGSTAEPQDTEQCWAHVMALAASLVTPATGQVSAPPTSPPGLAALPPLIDSDPACSRTCQRVSKQALHDGRLPPWGE